MRAQGGCRGQVMNGLTSTGALVALRIAEAALFTKIRLFERSELRIFVNVFSRFDNS